MRGDSRVVAPQRTMDPSDHPDRAAPTRSVGRTYSLRFGGPTTGTLSGDVTASRGGTRADDAAFASPGGEAGRFCGVCGVDGWLLMGSPECARAGKVVGASERTRALVDARSRTQRAIGVEESCRWRRTVRAVIGINRRA
ncbi:hypothetical protein DWG18_04215 [Lysobacter sp. TY2-98]|nr:hypothetical protein DWG18_04215 [Lysobacter sp. TY2-98]